MTIELHLLLNRRAGASEGDFLEAVRAAASLADLPGLEAGLVSRVSADDFPGLPGSTTGPAEGVADVILTLRGSAAQVMSPLAAIGHRMDGVIDRDRSRVVAVARHTILPGDGPVCLFFGLRRLERLSRAEFQDYWLNVHADHGRRGIPPYSYHQLHADAEQTEEAAGQLGLAASPFDGLVEVHFPDRDAAAARLREGESGEGFADAQNFMDNEGSVIALYQRLE